MTVDTIGANGPSHFRHTYLPVLGDESHPAHDSGSCITVEGQGETLGNAFEELAMQVTQQVVDPSDIRPLESILFQNYGTNPEELLVEWVNALVVEMSVRRILFSNYAVTIDGERLSALAWGETVPLDHRPVRKEIKGVNYAPLTVAKNAKGVWIARCGLDS